MENPYVNPNVELEAEWPETDDEWHAHARGEQHMHAHAETASPGAVALTGAIGFAIVVVCTLLIVFYFKQEVQREQVVKIERADMQSELRDRQAVWERRLTAAGEQVELPTGEAALVHHPLTEAMQRVAREYAQQP